MSNHQLSNLAVIASLLLALLTSGLAPTQAAPVPLNILKMNGITDAFYLFLSCRDNRFYIVQYF